MNERTGMQVVSYHVSEPMHAKCVWDAVSPIGKLAKFSTE